MERGTPEGEIAGLAPRRLHDQALPTGSNAALDVTEVFLEYLDRQSELSPEIVKLPLAVAQTFDDLLPASLHE